jgi:DUF4097 and DUF4098 domain-containing protein YvlB
MLESILLSLMLAGAAQAADTTFNVEPNGRLDVENSAGTVTVRTWNRNQVRIRTSDRGRSDVAIRHSARVVSVARPTPGRSVDIEITIPGSYAVSVHGLGTNADIEGIAGDVMFRSTNGSVRVRRATGAVRAETLSGSIDIEDVRGPIHARSTNRNIVLSRIAGDVTAETVNGSVTLRQITASRVDAATINGTVRFDGALANGGRYSFSSHNGEVRLGVAERSSATFHVSTVNGRFDAGFPVQAHIGGNDRHFSFVLGTGSARVDVETFNGNIRVVRP